ncbi:DMT family transporter [Alicyclobacillus tolerans]|uniref:DMT family transporter n=1 Tax=Alicyclobacillus tolerans TaxID=90970 RepID=UPI001F483B19|nr:DMT family transporter [Alicyclobacillus tolerans]MCF8566420.1 DMT family transporter [Alicyclobacillus tolerans]
MNLKTVLAVTVTLVFWSSAFAGIRQGLIGGYSPGHLVLLRFLSASSVFVLYSLTGRIRPPKLRDVPRIAIMGWIGISVYHISLSFGEQTVPAGTASLLIAAAPAFTALIAAFALKERLTKTGWVGIAIGFLGVIAITLGSGQSGGFTPNSLLVLLSAVSTSIFFVYQKPLLTRYSATELTAYFTWFGTLPMLLFLPGFAEQVAHASAAATWSVVYIGVFPAAIAYVAWAIALSSGRASIVSSSLYLDPVLAIFIAGIWLGQWPGLLSIAGGAVALVGVVAVGLWGTDRRAAAPIAQVPVEEAPFKPLL